VWLRAEYCGLPAIQSAVSQATIVFNSGKQALEKLMKKLDIPVGPDVERQKRAQDKLDIVSKKRRQTIQARDSLVAY